MKLKNKNVLLENWCSIPIANVKSFGKNWYLSRASHGLATSYNKKKDLKNKQYLSRSDELLFTSKKILSFSEAVGALFFFLFFPVHILLEMVLKVVQAQQKLRKDTHFILRPVPWPTFFYDHWAESGLLQYFPKKTRK